MEFVQFVNITVLERKGMSTQNEIDISSRELNVLSEIRRLEKPTQRRISDQTGISLGMTNIVIKELLNKGFIKIRRLNRRNVEYLLTNRGIREITRRSYRFLQRTVNTLKVVKGGIRQIVEERHAMDPETVFVVSGTGEIAEITEMVLRELEQESGIQWKKTDHKTGRTNGHVLVLHCDSIADDGADGKPVRGIQLSRILAKNLFCEPGPAGERGG